VRLVFLIWMVFFLAACQGAEQSVDEAASNSDPQTLRVATFNVSLYRKSEGQLIKDLSADSDPQIDAVSQIIRSVNPDILLLNEFDYDAEGEALQLFQENYLAVAGEFEPYPFSFVVPSNTGIPSGVDLDNSGAVISQPGDRGYGNDAFGFGTFPGQYSFALLSRYPIDAANIRSFKNFKWRDMPDNLIPTDYYSTEAQNVLRLSSKNHIDLPVKVGVSTVHIIAAHPTPPSFDGPEDRNGRRNHDEIRLVADFIDPARSQYLTDDQGNPGGLAKGSHFFVMGDLNADPGDGDSHDQAIMHLLAHPLVTAVDPQSRGGIAASEKSGGVNTAHKTPPSQDTADFRDKGKFAVGNLRLDYVLPSNTLSVLDSGVFWPADGEPGYEWVGPGFPPVSSDHRLVWVDAELPQ